MLADARLTLTKEKAAKEKLLADAKTLTKEREAATRKLAAKDTELTEARKAMSAKLAILQSKMEEDAAVRGQTQHRLEAKSAEVKKLQAEVTRLQAEASREDTLVFDFPAEKVLALEDQELERLEGLIRTERMQRAVQRGEAKYKRLEEQLRSAEKEKEKEKQEKNDLMESLVCEICCESPKDCTLNCGHQLCQRCSSPKECPFCRCPISSRTRTYGHGSSSS